RYKIIFSVPDLSEQYAPLLGLSVSEVGGALELIRAQAVNRGKGNQTFRETNVASLELLLPRDSKKTKLDVCAQEVVDSAEQRLDEQGVRNHSKMMVLRVSDSEQQQEQEEERKNNQNQSLQRTQKGFQILSERAEDLDSQPFLEIALIVATLVSQALILAMGFHEKGRSLMKRRQFDDALCHLLQADQQFSKCGSTLLGSVDNFAVLQLDIVWCYRALEALSCLDDGRARLQRAEQSFVQCYGEQQQRLRMIKGSTGREEVLFLRLYLLQSLLAYIDGNDAQARQQLSKVRALQELSPDTEKMEQLMTLGFTEREARLGLRACEGDVQEAALHISKQETGERETDGDVQAAAQLLLENQGELPPDLSQDSGSSGPGRQEPVPSSSTTTSSSSTSSSSTNSPEDEAAVSEVLGDISRHEEDYLDLTLEEESELIVTLQSYLSRSTQTV
uniref:Negative regulator of ubiquitin-like proteins 1 n=1 Tax=Neogobius melanostomus TaxID=47308 RepID=A0A8C6TCA2_9GOBI